LSHYLRNPLIPGQGPKLVIGMRNLRNDVRVDTSALAELTRPPKPLGRPVIPGGEHEYRSADEVAKGLGLNHDQERDFLQAMKAWLSEPNVVSFRKSLVRGLRKMAPGNGPLRGELARRAVQVWKATRGNHPSRTYGREGQPQDIIRKAKKDKPISGQLGLFGGTLPKGVTVGKPKKPKKQVKAAAASAGWQAIPAGKHGGQRRRKGNKWEYRYPDGKGGWSGQPQKAEPKPVKVPELKPEARKMAYKGLRTWVTASGHGTTKEELEQRLAAALEAQKQSEVFSFKVTHVKREKAQKHDDGRSVPAYDEWDVEVEHQAAIPGHQLTGKIETATGVVTLFHDKATVSKDDYARAQRGVCDVCKTKRRRNSVFVVQRESDDKHLLVGGECSKKFKGANLWRLANAMEEVDLGGAIADAFDEGEGFGGGGGGGPRSAEPHDLLGTALWLVRKEGYIGGADADAEMTMSTPDRVKEILAGGKAAPTKEEQAEIDREAELIKKDLPEIRKWIQERIPTDPDAVITKDIAFAVTVDKLLGSDFIEPKHFSRVVWVPHRYYKMVQRREQKAKAKPYEAPHAKMHNLPGEWTILSNTVKDSDYGSYNSVTAMDAEGHKIWFRQTDAYDLKEGDKVTLRGKLKDQKDTITFMSHMKVKNLSEEKRQSVIEAEAEEFRKERARRMASTDPKEIVQVKMHEAYDPTPGGTERQSAFRKKLVKAVVALMKEGAEIPHDALYTTWDYFDGYGDDKRPEKEKRGDPVAAAATRQYAKVQAGENPVNAKELLELLPEVGARMIRKKLGEEAAKWIFKRAGLAKSMDDDLARLRPRMILQPTSHPMELVWMAEEVPDNLHETWKRMPPGWPAADEILKAKYFKRTGSPGNYVYYYKRDDGSVQAVRQKMHPEGDPRRRGPYKKTKNAKGETVYTGGEKPPGAGWEKIPESPHGGMRRPVSGGKVRQWEFWYPGGGEKQTAMFGGGGAAPPAPAAPEAAKGGPVKWSKTDGGYEARGGSIKIRKQGKKWEMVYYGETIPITTRKPSFDHAEGLIREREAPKQTDLFRALMATGLFELRKAAGHKYLKRIPTGKPKPKYRYIYRQPKGGLTSSRDIQAGAKFKVEHAGKLGHFEVKGHDAHNGIVTLQHDESGRIAHIREKDLHRMITSHHEKQTKKVTEKPDEFAAERAELRQRLATSEAKRRRAEKKAPKKPEAKGPVPELPRASLEDLGKGGYDKIEGFSADPKDLETQASLMGGDREYAIIPQAGGHVLASRAKASGTVKEAKGDKAELVMRGSKGKSLDKVEVEYVVMEAKDLVASHDPTSFEPRAAYPEGVQERRYEVQGSGDQGKIDRIAREMEPALMVNTNPSAIDGSPMVTEEGIVLGGNGRTMGLQRAYQLYPEKAQEMKDYLAKHARGFGVSSAELSKMKQPVLVRRMKAETKDLTALGRRMNEALTQGMDPRTIEVALGQNYVTPELMDSLTHNMDPGQSMSEFLRTAKSRPFVEALERAGVIDQYNKDEFVEKGKGVLNEDGRMRVERVLTARMIPDASALSRMGTKLRQTIAKSVPSLIQMERNGWSVQEALELAVKVDNDMRLEGFSGGTRTSKKAGGKIKIPMSEHRESYRQQQTLGDSLQRQIEGNPLAQLLLETIQDKADKNMPSKWRQVALEADRQRARKASAGEAKGQAMLGGEDIVEERSLEDSIRGAFGLKKQAQQGGLFAMSLPEPDLVKAGAELTSYLMHAVLWEVENLIRGAVVDGKPPSGGQLLPRLQAFIKDQAAADQKFAQALGAHPLSSEALKGLLKASAMSRSTDLAKSMARSSLHASWRDLYAG